MLRYCGNIFITVWAHHKHLWSQNIFLLARIANIHGKLPLASGVQFVDVTTDHPYSPPKSFSGSNKNTEAKRALACCFSTI